jgi:hypothetical protein
MMADLWLIALGESPALALAAFLRIGAGLYLVSSGLISRSQGVPVRVAKVCSGVLLLFVPALIESWPSA